MNPYRDLTSLICLTSQNIQNYINLIPNYQKTKTRIIYPDTLQSLIKCENRTSLIMSNFFLISGKRSLSPPYYINTNNLVTNTEACYLYYKLFAGYFEQKRNLYIHLNNFINAHNLDTKMFNNLFEGQLQEYIKIAFLIYRKLNDYLFAYDCEEIIKNKKVSMEEIRLYFEIALKYENLYYLILFFAIEKNGEGGIELKVNKMFTELIKGSEQIEKLNKYFKELILFFEENKALSTILKNSLDEKEFRIKMLENLISKIKNFEASLLDNILQDN